MRGGACRFRRGIARAERQIDAYRSVAVRVALICNRICPLLQEGARSGPADVAAAHVDHHDKGVRS